jgi:DNA polymerase elongation subunit (family B)
LIKERQRYQQLVNQERAKPKEQQQQELISYYEARQLALKLLANAGYGAFARKEFAYSDYRVSEIITGYGRLIHKQMEKIGFERMAFRLCLGLQTRYLSDMAKLTILQQQFLQSNTLLNFLKIVSIN